MLHPDKVANLSDEAIIQNIIKESAEFVDGGLPALQDELKNAAITDDDYAVIHNPHVDGLITRANYIQQCYELGKVPADNLSFSTWKHIKTNTTMTIPYKFLLLNKQQ